jgi:hypothetical protein
LSKKERLLFILSATAVLVLRALAWRRYRFDSDEQQHLHVAWGWTAGLLPYRDVFDNHAPLFHLITAPVLAMVGERASVLHWMRLPMLALFAVVLWATYVVGRRLYDARVAAWGTLLLALFPPFFLKSLEYRTDNLWTAFWMLTLVVLTAGPLNARRLFLAGLLLGCALATSLKTGLLVLTLGAAALITWGFVLRHREEAPKPIGAATIGAFVAGLLLVPIALAAVFAGKGAWNELVYCVVTFNGNVALTRRNLWIGRAIFPFTTAALLYAAWRFRHTAHPWRYYFAVASGVFTVVLAGFWVMISPRDFLALMPLGAIFAAALATRARNVTATLATLVALSILGIWHYADRFENKTDWHTTMMNQALRLSRPGEMVMDLKGETIFRHRPFFYAFENITRAQIAHGIIRDTVPEDVVAKRAYVAQADGPMWPPRARAFLSANFLNMGRLRAAGQWIQEDGTFTIAIPGEYVIVVPRGVAGGTLDGVPHRGPRFLSAGPHRYSGEKGAAVMWAPAFERGHSPFHLRDTSF